MEKMACQLLQACGQTASVQSSGAAKWCPVRDTLVYCWPNNASRLAGLTQHDWFLCRQSEEIRLSTVDLLCCLLLRDVDYNSGLIMFLLKHASSV